MESYISTFVPRIASRLDYCWILSGVIYNGASFISAFFARIVSRFDNCPNSFTFFSRKKSFIGAFADNLCMCAIVVYPASDLACIRSRELLGWHVS